MISDIFEFSQYPLTHKKFDFNKDPILPKKSKRPENYDEKLNLISHQVNGQTFHATIPSVQLASDLISSNDQLDISEAALIFRAVLACQEIDQNDPHWDNFRWEKEDNEMAKPSSFYQGQPRCGFYAELSERNNYKTGAEFSELVQSGRLVDKAQIPSTYTEGTTRKHFVEYSRDDQVIDIEIDLFSWSTIKR
tara:strand:+ start:343 stop:921 length:579 start_codon:yes stop_codon:yes gene_type:complete